jgi:hypothetical protein
LAVIALAAACGGGDDDTPTAAPTSDATGAPAASTSETPAAAAAESAPTSVASDDVLCPPTTTSTTAPPATTLVLDICDLVDVIPPDELPDPATSTFWSGTISGTIQPVGCTPVDQSGLVVLMAEEDGSVTGLGRTVSGAYSCDDGASIPVMSNEYEIDGRLTDRFELTFSDGVQLTSSPIADGRAEIRQDTGFGVVTIALECLDC